MLKVKLICVGGIKEKFFEQAANEYIKRLGRFCKVEVVEIEERQKSLKPSQAEILKTLEQEAIETQNKRDGFTAVLDKAGKQFDSGEFAELIKQLSNNNSVITFVIGGSHGLSEAAKNTADLMISLGKGTYPHHLFRVMLLEQIYRAFMINARSDYHK